MNQADSRSDSIPINRVLFLILVSFLWGMNIVTIKISIAGFPPILAAGVRSVLAVVLQYSEIGDIEIGVVRAGWPGRWLDNILPVQLDQAIRLDTAELAAVAPVHFHDPVVAVVTCNAVG